MHPWQHNLFLGIFLVFAGAALFWFGLTLASRLPDGMKWIGIALAIGGAGVFLYSLRIFSWYVQDFQW